MFNEYFDILCYYQKLITLYLWDVYLLFKVNLNKTKQKWNKPGSKEVVVVVVVVGDVVVLVEVVVSDEEDLDGDENMEAFKNLFDKRVFRFYRIGNHLIKKYSILLLSF